MPKKRLVSGGWGSVTTKHYETKNTSGNPTRFAVSLLVRSQREGETANGLQLETVLMDGMPASLSTGTPPSADPEIMIFTSSQLKPSTQSARTPMCLQKDF